MRGVSYSTGEVDAISDNAYWHIQATSTAQCLHAHDIQYPLRVTLVHVMQICVVVPYTGIVGIVICQWNSLRLVKHDAKKPRMQHLLNYINKTNSQHISKPVATLL